MRVRGLTGGEREKFLDPVTVEKPAGNRSAKRRGQTTTEVVQIGLRARMCAWCIIDDEGNRVFSDADIRRLLNDKNAAAIEKIFDVAHAP